MKKLVLLTICLTGIFVCNGVDVGMDVGIDPQPTPPSSSTTTTTSTTSKPTTSSTTTSTPTPPTTPTTSSTTTTTTTTTTPKPTSTAAPSTTTVRPTPIPAPEIGTWSYTNVTTNETCIIARMALQLNIMYVNDNKPKFAIVNLPVNNTNVDGNCFNNSQQIRISWSNDNITFDNAIVLSFVNNVTDKNYKLASIQANIKIDNKHFPGMNVTTIALYNYDGAFRTAIKHSYKCDKVETLNMTDSIGGNKTVAVLKVNHLQLEAFHTASDKVFSTAEDCEASDTPDVVPIAVGCALAGLVVIVLIAYLIGRRRSQARGYLSM